MKAIKTIFTASFIFFIFSCTNDLGNYDYLSKEAVIPVTIADLKDTTVVTGELFEIEPQISNMDNESRYSYLWYTINPYLVGSYPMRDTLSTERNLSTVIKLDPGFYELYFEIRNDDLDLFVNKKCDFNVDASIISNGWYVLKTVNDETDFDFIAMDGLIIPDVLRTRAGHEEYYLGPIVTGNQQLKGKALKMAWQASRYSHYAEKKDGTFEYLRSKRVFHIATDKEMKTFNSDNLNLYKIFEDEFYEAPKADMQNLEFPKFNWNLYIINAGKLYSINFMSVNSGKFTYPITSEHSPNYQLHSDICAYSDGAIVFDKMSRSFFQVSTTASSLSKLSEPSNPELPSLSNMDYELIRLVNNPKSGIIQSAYCLMKSVSDKKYYLANLKSRGNVDYPFTTFREVPAQSKMPQADVFAVPQHASCIYFGKANILSYYIDTQDGTLIEPVIKKFPADETIAFIDNPEEKNLLVLTNSPAGWKLYLFPFIGVTADIKPEPIITYTGKGEGSYVMYRSN